MQLRLAARRLICACVLGVAFDAAQAAGSMAAPLAASSRSAAELMDVVMWNREPIGGRFALIATAR